MSQTGLFKRGGRYYFRLRVPIDLISHYGKTEFKFSLHSKDRSAAISKVRAELARVELEFAEVRTLQARATRIHEIVRQRITALDDDTIAAIAATWLEQNLAADDSLRAGGDIADLETEIQDTLKILRPAYGHGETKFIEPAMDEFVDHLGLDLQISPEDRRRLALKFLEASLQSVQIRAGRLDGQPVTTASVVPETTRTLALGRTTTGPTLTDVLGKWEKALERRPRTLQEVSSLVKGFGDFSHHKPIKTLTRQDGISFREHLKDTRGLAPATLKKNLALLNTLLNFAVDEGMLGANPFSRIKVQQPKTAPVTRLAYDEDDLAAIFTCPLYTHGMRPRGGGGEASIWFPLIGAYAGARLEEIALLTPQDLIKDPHYGWYFSITDLDEDKHVKTATSRRRVPVHPVLLQAGLIEYRSAMAADKVGWLFPDLITSKNGQRSGNWSKWWGRYAREKLGLSTLKVFHSLRHAFKTACRAAKVAEDIHDSLTGHASASVGRDYGEQPLSILRDAIDRIHYDRVVPPGRLWPRGTAVVPKLSKAK